MTIDQQALCRTIPWNPVDLPAWEANEGGEFNPFFEYADRATYLAWVAGWKADYAKLTAEIRALKAARPGLQRAGAYDSEAARPLVVGHRIARAMVALRRAAKRDSWAKRNAAKVA